MKKFFVKSILFLVLLALVTSVIVIVFEKGLGKIINSYTLKRQQLESQADSIEVLVLGTSQSLHGINPSYFCLKGYNLGNSAQSLFYDTHITLKYLDKMPRLKYVFISISDYSMGFELFDTDEKWRDYFYAQCWDIRFPEIKSSDLYLYSKILMYTPEVSLEYAFQLFHVDLTKDYYPNGWARMTTFSDINDHTGYKLANYALFNPKRCDEIKATLDTFLSALKKKNITPVFITPPVTSYYYKYVSTQKLGTMSKTISALCNKYGCSYFNYFTDNRFLATDFADCDHLNSSGAGKFSKILNNDILLQAKK